MDKNFSRYRALLLLKNLRNDDSEGGEGNFGNKAPSLDPNMAFASNFTNAASLPRDTRRRAHPLLSKTSQFSGVDLRMTPDPIAHEHAEANDPRLSLTKQLRNRPSPASQAPRLTRK